MLTMFIYRGYPGSGKNTVAEANAEKRGGVIVCRDDIRFMLFTKYWGLKRRQEDLVTKAQHAIIEAAVTNGSNVHVADTNLNPDTVKSLIALGEKLEVRIQIIDVDTPVYECINRDAKRKADGGRGVGAAVIQGMVKRYPRPWPAFVTMKYNEETEKVELARH